MLPIICSPNWADILLDPNSSYNAYQGLTALDSYIGGCPISNVINQFFSTGTKELPATDQRLFHTKFSGHGEYEALSQPTALVILFP